MVKSVVENGTFTLGAVVESLPPHAAAAAIAIEMIKT
jgi:hypothetical protein